MEHLFNALGDLVQAVTWAGLTLFGFYLMDLLLNPGIAETEDEKDEEK